MPNEKPLISVALYLRGAELEPGEISTILGLSPSAAQERGGVRAFGGASAPPAKFGLWALKVKSESLPVVSLINELLQKIGNPTVPLSMMHGVEDAQLDIHIALCDEIETREAVEFTLSNKQIARLSELGLAISITAA